MTATYFLHLTPLTLEKGVLSPIPVDQPWTIFDFVEAIIYASHSTGLSGPIANTFTIWTEVLTWVWREGFVPSNAFHVDNYPFGPCSINGFTTTTLRRIND